MQNQLPKLIIIICHKQQYINYQSTQPTVHQLSFQCNLNVSNSSNNYSIYIYLYSKIDIHIFNAIKTHGSESRDQEEAGLHDEQVNYLHVALL